MQSAWTISSRSSLEKGARARRKRDGGERRDGKERKEKEGGTRGERREGRGEGKGVKRRPTSNVRHHFFLLYSSQVREEGERRREFFFRFSVVHTSRDNASRAFTCVEPRREPLASPSRERNGRRAVLSSSPIIFHLENFQNYPAILFFFP